MPRDILEAVAVQDDRMIAARQSLIRCVTATIFVTGPAKKTAVRIIGTIAKGSRISPRR